MTTDSITPQKNKGGHSKAKVFGVLYLCGVGAAFYLIIYYWAEILARFQVYSYLGLFFVGLISGFSLPIPVPYMVITFMMGSVLQPALVGASCGLGLGIGGTLLHLTGRGGRCFFPMSSVFGFINKPTTEGKNLPLLGRIFHRFKVPYMIALARRRGALVVFVMSATINPFFVPVAIGLGTMRFKLWKFFLACWAGQTVKCIVIAYAGYLGLGTFLRWIDIL